MKNKILIWGIGKEFWRSYNILMLTVEKSNLEIVGYVSRDKIRDSVDGKKVFSPEEVIQNGIEYENIIVTTDVYYKEICNYGSNILNIDRKKYINGRVLKIPHFDWDKYIRIYNSGISFIAEFCWGGIIWKTRIAV